MQTSALKLIGVGQIHGGSGKNGLRRLAHAAQQAATAREKNACAEQVLGMTS
jgi:hypothetical protein